MSAEQPTASRDRLLLNWSHPRSVPVGDAEVSVHLGGSGRPVLILPGFPESPRAFMPLAEALAVDHLVILPYLPGTGPSRRPMTGGYSIPQQAKRMWLLCEALGARNIQVVGHGLGGAIAFWLALHRMRRIQRLVVLSTPLRGFSARWAFSGVRLGFPLVSDALLKLAGPAIIQQTYAQWTGPGFTVPPEELEHAVATWAPPGRRTVAASYYRALRNVLAFRQFQKAWIKVPTLMIFGSRQRGISRATIETSAEAIEKVRIKVFDGVGSFPHLERPDDVTKLVAGFLATQRRRRSGSESAGRPLE